MTAYTDFHYSPTGSGVISGAQVLEQTEQGINGLGQYVQDNVSGAIDTANEALTTAQNADSNATAAINLANSFNAQIIAANQTAGNALTTAQSAQNTANAASSLATTANNNAATALNTANAASAGVTTLTGTVNSLGNRMTAAENAINANAGNITTLQNNLATTNANVTAAANAASSAQATATSAQSTATLARNQAYVLRYTGTTITGGGTIAYADIDNTDNIKTGDKIIDATGVVYAIASVDIANETVTVSASEIINLAVLPDLFNSANTWTDSNTFSKGCNIYNSNNSGSVAVIKLRNSKAEILPTTNVSSEQDIIFSDKNDFQCARVRCGIYPAAVSHRLLAATKDTNGNTVSTEIHIRAYRDGSKAVYPQSNSDVDLGTSTNKWKSLNGINPGALSIFNPSASYDPIDIPTSWDTSGTSWNALNVSNLGDGWICITYYNCSAGDYILVRFGGTNGSNYPSLRFEAVEASDNKYYIYALFPVAKAFNNIYLKMVINSNASLTLHHYIPAYGTV